MLVVVGIILILAAILLPAMETAMGRAETTSCLANMRHLGMGLRLYSDDYDGRIVPAMLPHPDALRGICWDVTIQPYINNRMILLCPSDETPRRVHGALCEPHSYGINLALSQVGGYLNSSLDLYSLEDPIGTILLCELNGERYATHGIDWRNGGVDRVAARRHGGGSNFTFADGHAKWMRVEQTLKPDLLWDP